MKKYLTVCFILTFSFLLLIGVQVTDAKYTPKKASIRLIKTATNSEVYLLDDDGNRKLFVNQVTFWTHFYGDWNNIQANGLNFTVETISQEEFDDLPLGDNMTVKPGYLIGFYNSSKIYNVYDGNKLFEITQQVGQSRYGVDWANKAVLIQNGFETNYTKNNDDYVDSDSDGLSDIEEEEVYMTDPLSTDTDGDTYVDGNEVTAGQNPKGNGKMINFRYSFHILQRNQAFEIAIGSTCANEGEINAGDYFYNENSKTHWFDMEVDGYDNCSPACVVYSETGDAEINWRCTGLIIP